MAQNGATFPSPRGRKNYTPPPAPAEFDQDKRKGLVLLRRGVAQWRQGSRERSEAGGCTRLTIARIIYFPLAGPPRGPEGRPRLSLRRPRALMFDPRRDRQPGRRDLLNTQLLDGTKPVEAHHSET